MQPGLVSIKFDKSSELVATCVADYLDAVLISSQQSPQTEFLIEVKLGKLSLSRVAKTDIKPIILDFNIPRINRGKDPLLRAIGSGAHSVIDATAGWCGDAIHLAQHGLNVTAIEQNKIVAVLVMNAMERIADKNLKARFNFIQGNSITLLHKLAEFTDVVYLDPMYPLKHKSAAVKKELVILQKMIGCNGDDSSLFGCAMKIAQKRVVVKRPHYAEPIAPGKVGETRTKLVRFDIYKPYANGQH